MEKGFIKVLALLFVLLTLLFTSCGVNAKPKPYIAPFNEFTTNYTVEVF